MSKKSKKKPKFKLIMKTCGHNYEDGGIVKDTSLYSHNENSGFVTDQEPEIEEKKPKGRLKGSAKLDFEYPKKSKFDKLMELLNDRR